MYIVVLKIRQNASNGISWQENYFSSLKAEDKSNRFSSKLN